MSDPDTMTLDEYHAMIAQPAKRSKYNARRIEADGYMFDSLSEHRRYEELKLLLREGEIAEIEVHPVYILQTGFVDGHGKKHRKIDYEADLRYVDTHTGLTVVEDVKGIQTPAFKIKYKLLMYRYPDLDFRIVGTARKANRK